MNSVQLVGELYDVLERAGVKLEGGQVQAVARGFGVLIRDYTAAVQHNSGGHCVTCRCRLPVAPCGHPCCTSAGEKR